MFLSRRFVRGLMFRMFVSAALLRNVFAIFCVASVCTKMKQPERFVSSWCSGRRGSACGVGLAQAAILSLSCFWVLTPNAPRRLFRMRYFRSIGAEFDQDSAAATIALLRFFLLEGLRDLRHKHRVERTVGRSSPGGADRMDLDAMESQLSPWDEPSHLSFPRRFRMSLSWLFRSPWLYGDAFLGLATSPKPFLHSSFDASCAARDGRY